MSASPPDRQPAFERAAGVALALMFVVVAASAFIRLTLAADASATLPIARGVHRAAATFTAVAVLLLALLAWRSAALRARVGLAAGAALLLTLALSALGVATGTTPPPPAQFANLFGGLALLALLAWLSGRAQRSAPVPVLDTLAQLTRVALVLGLAQAALGAALATLWSASDAIALTLHVLSGLVVAAFAFALGIRLAGAGVPIALGLIGAALAAPLAGSVSALLELSPAAALAHPLFGAATLLLLARLDGRASASQRPA